MITLRYDKITAVQCGYPDPPERVMKDLGYEAALVRTAKGSIFFEVDKVLDPLPPFLERQDIVDGRIEISPDREIPPAIEFPGIRMHFHQDPMRWTFNFGAKGGKASE